MKTEPAKLSAARFLESHFRGKACDHEAVSECLRCNALFLANETLKPQASNEAHGWRQEAAGILRDIMRTGGIYDQAVASSHFPSQAALFIETGDRIKALLSHE